MRESRVSAVLRASLVVLAALVAAYPLLPNGGPRETAYDVIAAGCLAAGLSGVRRLPATVRHSWRLVLLGFGGWVLGDLVFSLEQYVVHLDSYPAPSDACYVSAYCLIAAGVLRLVRGRRTRADVTPTLDAAIVAVGFTIVVGTFYLTPIVHDATLGLAGRVVASAYPVGDVLILAVLVRLWSTVGSRTAAFRWLLAALVSTLVADCVWNALAMEGTLADTPPWLDVLWLTGYLSAAAAACSPSAARLGDGVRRNRDARAPLRRLLVLGCGLTLPGLTLLADRLLENRIPWLLVSLGSITMSALVLLRMGLLLRTVEVQAVQLAALAGSDALTGAPNRRTWDHELGRAVQDAREQGGGLAVALLDLDHFKRFNDRFGHPAGDLLLREAVAAWSAQLAPGELLARYGGEEFGILVPGGDAARAGALLERMQAVTPRGQAFSAGIATWHADHDPAALVGLADRALYDAKQSGRGCVRIAHNTDHAPTSPPLRIALQPIVDLRAGRAVGHEALSRFTEGDPEAVFALAHQDGYGPELEATAIEAALRGRPADGYLSINLSVEALTSPAVREVLPADLSGLVVEITEQTDVHDWAGVTAALDELRRRGASIAVDDWGRDYSNVERVLRVRPDLVKLDRMLLDDLDVAGHREVLGGLVTWAHAMGARVCAEGIETERQWRILRDLGVELGQGFHFGRPEAAAVPVEEPVEDAGSDLGATA